MSQLSAANVMKAWPVLSPEDSIGQALSLLRRLAVPALAVVHEGRPAGLFSEASLLALLTPPYAESQWEAVAKLPVAEAMSLDFPLIYADAPLAEIARALQEHALGCAPVITRGGYYEALVCRREVVAALCNIVTPGHIGGMATPLGVYLTNGTVRAGAGDLGLVSAGALLALLWLLASGLVNALCTLVQHYTALPLLAIREGIATPAGALYFGRTEFWPTLFFVAQLGAVFLFMRLFALSGTHGAEHQVVHTIEQGEELTPGNVLSHSPVHPRCGTNLAAMMLVIGAGIYYFIGNGRITDPSLLLTYLFITVIAALLLRQKIGALLQRFLTTKQPSERQLLAAIGVGKQLLERCRQQGERKAGGWQRIWNIGLIQVLSGAALTSYIAQIILDKVGILLPL
jgi:CBS domain-containing protein